MPSAEQGTTCGDCGSPMRQQYIVLTFKGGCQRIPDGHPVCTNRECIDRQREQDRADQKVRDEAALQRAIERGLILP